MMAKFKGIQPIHELAGSRQHEHGRVRLGHQVPANNGKTRPVKLKTARFTSPDEAAIRTIASIYGGEPRPWHNERGKVADQWEVFTTIQPVDIWLPSGGLDSDYERWDGGTKDRTCDGITCEMTRSSDTESWTEPVPCLCNSEQKLTCKPTTRIKFILPCVEFAGVWRLQSTGWNAAAEIPGIVAMLEELQGDGLVAAKLSIEERTEPGFRKPDGKRAPAKKYVVPVISLAHTATQIAAGLATPTAIAAVERGELPPTERAPLALAPWQSAPGAADADEQDQGVDDEQDDDEGLEGRVEHGADVPADDADDVADGELCASPADCARALALANAPRWSVDELVDRFGDQLDRKVLALLDGSAKWSTGGRGGVVKA